MVSNYALGKVSGASVSSSGREGHEEGAAATSLPHPVSAPLLSLTQRVPDDALFEEPWLKHTQKPPDQLPKVPFRKRGL